MMAGVTACEYRVGVAHSLSLFPDVYVSTSPAKGHHAAAGVVVEGQKKSAGFFFFSYILIVPLK